MKPNRLVGRRTLAVAGVSLSAMLAFAGQAHASYTAQVRAGTLQVAGNSAADKLDIHLTDPNTLGLDVGNDGTVDFSFDRSTFTAINVVAGGGDDEVVVDRSGGSFAEKAITIDGGAGDDRLIGGDGAEVFVGGAGNDFVDGNIGADTAFLGTGNDTFQWDPGDGSDTVEGEAGKDTLQFNGSNAGEKVDVTANGTRALLHRDVANISMDLNGVETVNYRALGSADTTTVGDLGGTDVRSVNVDQSAFDGSGDGAADSVVVNGTSTIDKVSVTAPAPGVALARGLAADVTVTGGEPNLDKLDIHTLGGADTVTTDPDVTGSGVVAVDGGDGSDSARFLGTGDDDQIGIANNGTAVRTFAATGTALDSTAVENLLVQGLDGNDTITGQNGIATLTHLTVDGGTGEDTLGGGDGDDTLIGGTGDDVIDGNRGNDTATGGAGNDTFVWDPGDGSDALDGQADDDTLRFNGSNAGEKIEVSRNGGRVRLTRDVAAITMDFDTIEHVLVRTLGSVDQVTIDDLSKTSVDTADVDLGAFDGTGDGSADTVTLNGSSKNEAVNVTREGDQVVEAGLPTETRISGSEPGVDLLRVNTLAGNDSVFVDPAANDLIATAIDLGTGQQF